jgi:hypothetical protein
MTLATFLVAYDVMKPPSRQFNNFSQKNCAKNERKRRLLFVTTYRTVSAPGSKEHVRASAILFGAIFRLNPESDTEENK